MNGNIETRLLGRNGNTIALARNRESRLVKSIYVYPYISRCETIQSKEEEKDTYDKCLKFPLRDDTFEIRTHNGETLPPF